MIWRFSALRFTILHRLFPALCLLLSISGVGVQAQERSEQPGRRTLVAVRMNGDESINLDGRLEEPIWQRAVPATDFLQQDPINGGIPTERTEVRIVFDRQRLYMGVICFDSEPDKLLGNTMKRDEFLMADDRFMWIIDTFLDSRTGYFFEMNPSGLMADSLRGTGGSNERAWDGIWNARVRRSEIGWTIEIELPFRTLNFDPNAPAWGINFQRSIRRKNEENLWSGHARNQGLFHLPSAGLLTGISEVSQGLGLDVKPYLVGTLANEPGRGSPAFIGDADVGMDLFYNLTPGLRANFTVNTDFAQTEVDQRRVNLTRFSLFFPEKRDFFLDGSTFFNFYLARTFGSSGSPVQPFFSRRIGLDENGIPQKIDFGVKLTGQLGGQDIGLLQVRTGREGAVAGEDFTVLRLKRRLLSQSYVGMLYTRRTVREDGTTDLHTAGLDWELSTSTFLESKNLKFNGFFLGNTNPLKSGENLAYGLRLDYPNDRWNARMSFNEVQENHDPAIGFTQRTEFRSYNPVVQFSPRPRGNRWIRRLSFGGNFDLRTDMENRFLTRKLDFTVFQVNFHSRDSIQMHVVPSFERLVRDFEIHPGIILPTGSTYSFNRYSIQAGTAPNRIVSGRLRVELGDFFSGDRQEVTLGLSLRPRRGVVVRLESEWNRISLLEGRFETRLYRAVADTQFSPWIQLSNTFQHDSVSEVLAWQSRFRWILTPGNDLYIVYLHNWLDESLDPLNGFQTLDRNLAMKLVFTHRF
ncbi:MAG: DUF5916 domain-containing protein [Acidobacteria bacterium]|nr:DUF5916 domain-containing protein [Acidobacteriota bacterium]